jgi:hypothetical protein
MQAKEKSETLENFLRKKSSLAMKPEIKPKAVKEAWLKNLNHLYQQIEAWLALPCKERLLTMAYEEVMMYEEPLGTYPAQKMIIKVKGALGEQVTLTPIGAVLIGGYGRVDMENQRGERAMLVTPERGVWKFAERMPRLRYDDVTEERFKEILQSLLA